MATVGNYYIFPHPQIFKPSTYTLGFPGVGYSFKWTPVFFNQSQKALNGASIDIALAATPLHNFELTYPALRNRSATSDGHPYNQANYNPIYWEMRRLMGFFNLMGGTNGRFAFDNPEDDFAVYQLLGVGDGTNLVFPIVRSLGDPQCAPYATAEGVGIVDPTTLRIYDDSGSGPVLVSAANYTLTNTAAKPFITYNGGLAPAPGDIIYATFSFYYYCKFAENISVFEQFSSFHWSNASVKLQSCRPGA